MQPLGLFAGPPGLAAGIGFGELLVPIMLLDRDDRKMRFFEHSSHLSRLTRTKCVATVTPGTVASHSPGGRNIPPMRALVVDSQRRHTMRAIITASLLAAALAGGSSAFAQSGYVHHNFCLKTGSGQDCAYDFDGAMRSGQAWQRRFLRPERAAYQPRRQPVICTSDWSGHRMAAVIIGVLRALRPAWAAAPFQMPGRHVAAVADAE